MDSVAVEDTAHGLDLGHSVEEVREEPLPHGMGGPADHQDMLNSVFRGIT